MGEPIGKLGQQVYFRQPVVVDATSYAIIASKLNNVERNCSSNSHNFYRLVYKSNGSKTIPFKFILAHSKGVSR